MCLVSCMLLVIFGLCSQTFWMTSLTKCPCLEDESVVRVVGFMHIMAADCRLFFSVWKVSDVTNMDFCAVVKWVSCVGGMHVNCPFWCDGARGLPAHCLLTAWPSPTHILRGYLEEGIKCWTLSSQFSSYTFHSVRLR